MALPLVGACGGPPGGDVRGGDAPTIRKREAARVRTAPATVQEMVRTLSTTTTVESEKQIDLFPRIAGVVDEVLVEEGDRVDAGQELAVMDDRAATEALNDAKVALEDAQNAVHGLELAVREADERAERAKLTWDQSVREVERNENAGLLSEVELDRLRLTRDTNQRDYQAARLGHEGAQADLEKQSTAIKRASVVVAQRELEWSYTRLTAPFAGVIASRSVRVGDTASSAAAAFTLTDPDHLRTVVYRPQRELAFFQAAGTEGGDGIEITVTPEALPGHTYEGRIRILSPTIDPESGSFRLTIDLEQPKPGGDRPRLLPGMLVRLDIVTERRPDALVVPKRALRREGDEYSIFVIRGDVAHEVGVREGFSNDESVEILAVDGAEIAPGDQVVVVGNRDLEDGSQVLSEAWAAAEEPESDGEQDTTAQGEGDG